VGYLLPEEDIVDRVRNDPLMRLLASLERLDAATDAMRETLAALAEDLDEATPKPSIASATSCAHSWTNPRPGRRA
jgi:hypothetical protein